MRRAGIVLLASVLLVATRSRDARADEPAPGPSAASVDRARALNQAAVSAYLDGRFAVAAATLEEAVKLAPTEPVLFLNLGKAREAERDRPRAIAAYERYVALSPTSRDRVVVETKIATLRRELSDAAELERQRALTRWREEERARPGPSTSRVDVLPFVVGGVGLAAVGAGAALGLLARGAIADARDASTGVDAKEKEDRAHGLALGANVAFVAGGALVLTGATWAVLDARKRSRVDVALGVEPRGLLVRGTF